MSQTARIKTVINDLTAAKKACENLKWGFAEAGQNIDLEISGHRGIRMVKGTDNTYTVTGNFDGLDQTKTMNQLNQEYAKVKLFSEVATRSDHGITGLGDAMVQPDGSLLIIGEVDETLLVG